MKIKFSFSAFAQFLTFALFLAALLGFPLLADFEKQSAVLMIGEMAAIMLTATLLSQSMAEKNRESNPLARMLANRGKAELPLVFLFVIFWFGFISYAITKSPFPAIYFLFTAGMKWLDFKFAKTGISIKYFAVSFILVWLLLFLGALISPFVCRPNCHQLEYAVGAIYFGVLTIVALVLNDEKVPTEKSA